MKRAIAIALSAMSLGSCGNPYALKVGNVKLDAEQEKGVIQFTDPKLYKREALINERKGERAYLEALLKETEKPDFDIKPEIVREIERIQALSASLSARVDPAAAANFQRDTEVADLKHQQELTRLRMQQLQLNRDLELFTQQLEKQETPSAAPGTGAAGDAGDVTAKIDPPDAAKLIGEIEKLRGTLDKRLEANVPEPRAVGTGGAGPIDKFNDITAYRDVLKSAINAVSLDELHDRDGNSLFRVQLEATVLPGEKDTLDTLGALRLRIGKPEWSDKELDNLYRKWLLHVNRNLNLAPNPHDPIGARRIRTSPSLVTLGQGGDFYDITLLELPKKDLDHEDQLKAEQRCKGVRYAERLPHLCWYVRIATPPVASGGVAIGHLLDTGVQFTDAVTNNLRGAREAVVSGIGMSGASLSADVFALDAECRTFRVATTTALPRAGSPRPGLSPADALTNARAIRVLWPYASAVIGYLTETDIGVGTTDPSIAAGLTNATKDMRDVHAAAGAFLDALATKNEACRERLLATPRADSPGRFDSVIKSADTRVTVYDVAPTERVQRISTAARAADAIALAAAAAGQLPSYGVGLSGNVAYSRSATGKADAIERAPLVVGFAEPAVWDKKSGKPTMPSFGWLLGPPVNLDPENQTLELSQRLKPYDLFADLSLPGWWPYFTLNARTAWAPNWRTNIDKSGATLLTDDAHSLPRELRVPMVQNAADLDGLTTLVLEETTGERVAYPSILSIEPRAVSACAQSVEFQVRGENIWRASLVHVGGLTIAGNDVEVLPDMRGVLVKAATASIPAIVDGPNLVTVWTKDGPASFPITFDDERKDDNSCRPRRSPARQPTGPVITAVAPAAISVCDTDAVFTVQGKNLDGAPLSAVFGTLVARDTREIGPKDGTVLQVEVKNIEGNKKFLELDKTTLAVRTSKGTATTEITVVQSNCSK